jgi:hypothetical protein
VPPPDSKVNRLSAFAADKSGAAAGCAGGRIRAVKECPLCAETMTLIDRKASDRLPLTGQSAVRRVREWVCPECDYFEEAEPGED